MDKVEELTDAVLNLQRSMADIFIAVAFCKDVAIAAYTKVAQSKNEVDDFCEQRLAYWQDYYLNRKQPPNP